MPRKRVRDDQWKRAKDLLPGKATDCGVTAKDNRLFVEAVLIKIHAVVDEHSQVLNLALASTIRQHFARKYARSSTNS